MAKTKKKTAKKREFMKEISKFPTLEELLWAMNGMEKCKVFTKLELDCNGNVVKAFTKKGGELYGRLTAFVYGLFNLVTHGENTVPYIEKISPDDIMETLDAIVRDET